MKNYARNVFSQKSWFRLFVKIFLVGIFACFQLSASAQDRTISGTVTGADGEAIPGVTLVVTGTTIGVQTDFMGQFTLSIPANATTLEFRFVGFETERVPIDERTVYDVVLTEDVIGLEEVIVVGYGTQKRISVTGAISQVDSEFLVKNPSATVSSTLAGRVTGLTSVQYSGLPGQDEPQLYVRGVGSLTTGASRPLLLVDGVERPFSQLDPNEIENITVLKDASATAVYGIRGANGVIIITTKRGVEGAPVINFSTTAGAQLPTRLVQMTDSYQYALAHNQARRNDNPDADVFFSDEAIRTFRDGGNLVYNNTPWVDEIVKSAALQTQQNINIRGGSSNLRYFASLGYLDQDGLFDTFGDPNSYTYGYNRYNYRTNLDLDLTPTTNLNLTIGGRSEDRRSPGNMPSEAGFTVLYWAVPFSGAVHEGRRIHVTNDYIPTTEKKDGLNAIGWGSGYRTHLTNVMNIDFGGRQELDAITEGLAFRFKYANNLHSIHEKRRTTSHATYNPYFRTDVDPSAPGDSTIVFKKSGSDGVLGFSEHTDKARNWYMEGAFSYDREFGPHAVTGLLLYNQSRIFYPEQFTDIPLGYVGMAARTTYNYRLRYMLDLNLGYNGSENFAEDRRFGFFPAVSVAWTLTEENFMRDRVGFLDYLKFRYSYGIVGNDRLGANRFLYRPDSYSAASGWYSFGDENPTLVRGAAEGSLGNPLVTWETATKQNYGVDLTVLDSRMSISVDRFIEHRDNILTTRNTVPIILSMSLPAVNIGEVENKGYETELRWRDRFGNFNYYITANMSFARNKVLYMDEIPRSETYLYRTGLPINQRFGYVFDGFWTQEDINNIDQFPNHNYNPSPGDARYRDLNNDGVIDSDDQMAIGYPDYPEYIAAVNSGFSFRGFDFSMLWTGVTNTSRVLSDTFRVPFGDVGDRALPVWLNENSWTPETHETALAPRMTFLGRLNNTRGSDLWIRDASYIRLKNIEVGYSFSPEALSRFGVTRLRLHVTGYNMLTFDYLKFMDPEGIGRDYPVIKIANFGANVTF